MVMQETLKDRYDDHHLNRRMGDFWQTAAAKGRGGGGEGGGGGGEYGAPKGEDDVDRRSRSDSKGTPRSMPEALPEEISTHNNIIDGRGNPETEEEGGSEAIDNVSVKAAIRNNQNEKEEPKKSPASKFSKVAWDRFMAAGIVSDLKAQTSTPGGGAGATPSEIEASWSERRVRVAARVMCVEGIPS